MTTKAQKAREELLYDARLIERNLRLGRLDPKEYEIYLKSLPDDNDKGEVIEYKDESLQDAAASNADQLTFTSG